ncbi:MFS transporter [Undibacterium squillarum]|uniref:MFS transporter n=1 Tax=Undibacterium squillarum TaxID=1131567 RepID=A0ABQ2XRY6_9BURK|nr:MFS transporter [Undibacterium squillarum]GGX29704.1 MFS transporter [Undibacterium squillarum]
MTTAQAMPAVPVRQDALVIALVGLAHSISHFFHLILAPLFPWIKAEFGLSYAELGMLMTAFFVVSGIGQASSGFVVDKLGARTVLFFGVFCLMLSAIVLSMANGVWMLAAGAVIAGVGNSVFHPADYSLLNQKVSHPRLAYAFSVHGLTGNLGWACAPVFLVGIAQIAGWRSALLSAAALPALVLCLLFAYREVLQTKPSQKAVQGAKGGGLDFLKLPTVWMCFAFFFLTAMALGGVHSFAATALRELYGMSLNAATSAYSAFMLASAFGMFAGGVLAARGGKHDRTIAIAFVGSAVFALILATGAGNGALALALMAATGFCTGIAGPSRDLMIRAAAPANATGRVYGIVYSGLDSGLAIAPVLFGVFMDQHMVASLFIGVAIFQILAIATAVNVGNNTRARQLAAQA